MAITPAHVVRCPSAVHYRCRLEGLSTGAALLPQRARWRCRDTGSPCAHIVQAILLRGSATPARASRAT
jgi:hypothetical protein